LRVLQRQLEQCRRRQQQTLSQRLDQIYLRLQAQRPQVRLKRDRDRLMSLSQRLRTAQVSRLRSGGLAATRIAARLRAQHPLRRLELLRNRLQQARRRLQPLAAMRLQRDARALAAVARALNAVSPLATLSRGFAIVQQDSGHVLRSVDDAQVGQRVAIRLVDGELDAALLAVRRTADD
jgi:exodeoxyribonuclease VII large subunit